MELVVVVVVMITKSPSRWAYGVRTIDCLSAYREPDLLCVKRWKTVEVKPQTTFNYKAFLFQLITKCLVLGVRDTVKDKWCRIAVSWGQMCS